MANPNGAKPDKLIRDALRKAVLELVPGTPRTYLRDIAETIRDEAAKGEAWACNMVADRLDGKAHQTSEVTVTKHESTDYDRPDLLAIANSTDGSERAVVTNGRGTKPDRVH